jgi:hypothetical protein
MSPDSDPGFRGASGSFRSIMMLSRARAPR